MLVANLKPVKLRGVLSQGMILAASDSQDNDIEVLSGADSIRQSSKIMK